MGEAAPVVGGVDVTGWLTLDKMLCVSDGDITLEI